MVFFVKNYYDSGCWSREGKPSRQEEMERRFDFSYFQLARYLLLPDSSGNKSKSIQDSKKRIKKELPWPLPARPEIAEFRLKCVEKWYKSLQDEIEF